MYGLMQQINKSFAKYTKWHMYSSGSRNIMVIATTTIDTTTNTTAVHIIKMDIDDENCFCFLVQQEKMQQNKMPTSVLVIFLLSISLRSFLIGGWWPCFLFPSMNPLCCKYADLFSTVDDYIWRIVHYKSRDKNIYFSL